jgi:hypothetical protein
MIPRDHPAAPPPTSPDPLLHVPRTAKTSRKSASGRGSSRGGARKAASKSSRRNGGNPSPGNPSAGISRIDQESRRTHGYFVRVGYKMTDAGSRPTASAYFGDASHGGKKKAWEAAEAWLKKARRGM